MPKRPTFNADFKRFFLRGLSALLPTAITLFVITYIYNLIDQRLGSPLMQGVRWTCKWVTLQVSYAPAGDIQRRWDAAFDKVPEWAMSVIGVLLAFVLVYMVGLLVGNLIGRSIWRLLEMGVMRIPLVKAIYPAVRQVTDFLLSEQTEQFASAQPVAVQHRDKDVWSVGLVMGSGIDSLNEQAGEEMLTVFLPGTPTAVTGYTVIVPRRRVVVLDMKVEDVMRLHVTGGVVTSNQRAGGAKQQSLPNSSLSLMSDTDLGAEDASPASKAVQEGPEPRTD